MFPFILRNWTLWWETLRAMKNCGLAKHTLIVIIRLRKFIQLRVSSRYFLESFLCNVHLLPPGILAFYAPLARLSAWWIDSRWNKRDPEVAHFLSTRLPLLPDWIFVSIFLSRKFDWKHMWLKGRYFLDQAADKNSIKIERIYLDYLHHWIITFQICVRF